MDDSDSESFHSACEEISDDQKEAKSQTFLGTEKVVQSGLKSEEIAKEALIPKVSAKSSLKEKVETKVESAESKAPPVKSEIPVGTDKAPQIGEVRGPKDLDAERDIGEEYGKKDVEDDDLALEGWEIEDDLGEVDSEVAATAAETRKNSGGLKTTEGKVKNLGDSLAVKEGGKASETTGNERQDVGESWEAEEETVLDEWRTEGNKKEEESGDGWDDWETTDFGFDTDNIKKSAPAGDKQESKRSPAAPARKPHREKEEGRFANLAEAGSQKGSFWNWNDFSGVLASVSSAVESGLGLPSAEDMARRRDEVVEEEGHDVPSGSDSGKDQSGGKEMHALGGFLSDIGSTFVSGSLDVLETLGKATFEKLTVPKQGGKRRRLIFEPQENVNLSDVLKELREKQRLGETSSQDSEAATVEADATFIDLFESYGGFVHLEGLEMLSANFSMGKQGSPTLNLLVEDVVKSHAGSVPEEMDMEDDFPERLQEILDSIGLPYDGSHLMESEKRCCRKNTQHFSNAQDAFRLSLEILAEFTAHSVQTLHKLGQLTLIAVSSVSEVPFAEFLSLVGTRLICFANVSVKHLNAFLERDKKAEDFITAVFLASDDAFTYVQQSVRLLGPLLSQKRWK